MAKPRTQRTWRARRSGRRHYLPLAEAATGYDMFFNKQDNCEKVVLTAA
jgi:hypothetical protein